MGERSSQVETELSVLVGFADTEEGKGHVFPSLGGGSCAHATSFIHRHFIHSRYPVAVFKASPRIAGLEMDTGEDHDQLAQSGGRVTYKQSPPRAVCIPTKRSRSGPAEVACVF